jgi:hypothetical protein
MSSIGSFPKAKDSTVVKAFSSLRAETVADSIWALFDKLSLTDQQIVVERLTKAAQLIPASRAGDVLGTVARFLPQRREWTAEEIRLRLAESGVEAAPRAVFNAIGYLARKGRIERLGAGRYRVDGIAVVTAADLGGEPLRYDYDD